MSTKIERPTALDLLVPARMTREKVTEFVPIITFHPKRTNPQIALLIGEDDLIGLLNAYLPAMRRQLGPADWIALTADSYVMHFPVDEPTEPPEQGLAAAFAEGDPRVIEEVTVIIVDRDGTVDAAAQSYRYLPSEGFEWDEPRAQDTAAGEVVDLLVQFL